jgi:hypothetical protein
MQWRPTRLFVLAILAALMVADVAPRTHLATTPLRAEAVSDLGVCRSLCRSEQRRGTPSLTTSMARSTPSAAPSPSHGALNPAQAPGIFSRYLYGIGPEASGAVADPLTRSSRIGILTSWFNGAQDLGWMSAWRGHMVNDWWDHGYVLHLIVYDPTPLDPACTCKRWPISDRFPSDMAQLSQIFAGPNDGKHTVLFSLDTEFQTYIQPNNQYNSATAWYYERLQSNLLRSRAAIKTAAPNALVSFSWGGWQTRWDDPVNGGGRSMIPHFAQTMRQMDFVSFQAMQTDANVADILQNARSFRIYNPHLMVSHYGPDNGSSSTFINDIAGFFTTSFVDQTRGAGLFGFSFLNANLMRAPGTLAACIAGINQFTH